MGLAVGLMLTGTAAFATPAPESGPDTGGTEVIIEAPKGVTFIQVSAGNLHSLALDDDGNAYAWGNNSYGQLGNDAVKDSPVPSLVKVPEGVRFTHISAGSLHSLAIGDDGNSYGWGHNVAGQLGTEPGPGPEPEPGSIVRTPTLVAGGKTFTHISAGKTHSLAIDTHGNAYGWGENEFGQTGTAGTGTGTGSTSTSVFTPTRVVRDVVVTSVTFGSAPGTDLVDNGDGTVSVTTPAHAAGPVDVVVSWTLNGAVQPPAIHADGFTYLATVPTVTDPTDQTVGEGSVASFTVEVAGDPAPTVTWEYSSDGGSTWAAVTATEGTVSAGGKTLTTVATTAAHDGSQYRATAVNDAGTVPSAPATLTVKAKTGTGTGGGTNGNGGGKNGGGTGGGSAGGGSLAHTGSTTTAVPLISGALLLAGAALALNARRTRTASTSPE